MYSAMILALYYVWPLYIDDVKEAHATPFERSPGPTSY